MSGASSTAGGGSGGSIWIITAELDGYGVFSCTGGDGHSGTGKITMAFEMIETYDVQHLS